MEAKRVVRNYECEVCYMNGPDFPGWDKSFTHAGVELVRALHGTFRPVIELLFDSLTRLAGMLNRGLK